MTAPAPLTPASEPADSAALTDEELAEMEAQDAWLRDEGNWWKCADCEWCSECKRLSACAIHDDSDNVFRLIADLRAARAEVAFQAHLADHGCHRTTGFAYCDEAVGLFETIPADHRGVLS